MTLKWLQGINLFKNFETIFTFYRTHSLTTLSVNFWLGFLFFLVMTS